MNNDKRIKLSIQLPSTNFKRFIEKILKDEDFFEAAVENPVSAFKESGINVQFTDFTPKDFANFFGALAGVREIIRKRNLKEISFEQIFGQAAEIRGSSLMAETFKGMWTLFNKNALMEKEMLSTMRINFETLSTATKENFVQALKESDLFAMRTRDLKTFSIKETNNFLQFKTELDMAGKTYAMSDSNVGYFTHFNNEQGSYHGTESGIHRGTETHFGGISLIEDLLNGPLINPVELASITSSIKTFTVITEQMEL